MRYFLLRVIVLMMASAPVFAQTITGKVTIASDEKPFPDPTHISTTNTQLYKTNFGSIQRSVYPDTGQYNGDNWKVAVSGSDSALTKLWIAK